MSEPTQGPIKTELLLCKWNKEPLVFHTWRNDLRAARGLVDLLMEELGKRRAGFQIQDYRTTQPQLVVSEGQLDCGERGDEPCRAGQSGSERSS